MGSGVNNKQTDMVVKRTLKQKVGCEGRQYYLFWLAWQHLAGQALKQFERCKEFSQESRESVMPPSIYGMLHTTSK
jgi:hypothetical protein